MIADVADDYTINVTVNKGAKVDPTSATLTLYMRGVTGLGFDTDEERTHSITVSDILSVGTQDLDGFVDSLETFGGATLTGTVKTVTTTTTTTITKDENGTEIGKEETTTTTEDANDYVYTFVNTTSPSRYSITGTQTGAQAAWAELVEHLTAGTEDENSKAIIAKDSYLVVDGQTLVIEKELTLDNLADRAANYQAILDASTLENKDLGKTDALVEIYLVKGTKLAVGSSIVTLDDNARIVLDADINLEELLGLENNDSILEWARENITSTEALIKNIVFLFNPIVSAIDEVGTVKLDVIFEVEETEEKVVIEETKTPSTDDKDEEETPVTPDTPKDETKDEVSTQTGDNAPVVAYASLTVVAGLALLVLALRKRFGYSK